MADTISPSDGVFRTSVQNDAVHANVEAHILWRSGVSGNYKTALTMPGIPDVVIDPPPAGNEAAPVFSQPNKDMNCPGNADYLAFIERTSRLIYDPADLGDIEALKKKHPCVASTDEAVRFADQAVKVANDPYTDVFSKDEAQLVRNGMEGHFSGVGVQLGRVGTADSGPVSIVEVYPNSPAEDAGIKKGDSIVAINGESVEKQTLENVLTKMVGEVGTGINLTVDRQGQTRDFALSRRDIEVPAVTDRRIGEIGYIHLHDLSQDDSPMELMSAIAKHDDAKALILDLRDNPGGQVGSALQAVSLIMEKGEIMKVRSRVDSDPAKPEYEVERYFVTPEGLKVTGEDTSVELDGSTRLPDMVHKPLVVLTNENTASAAELLAAALKDNNEATLIGKTTFGKGVGQHIMSDLPGESMLSVTNFRFFTPSGKWIGDGNKRRTGVEPNVVVENSKDAEIGSLDDAQLNAALKHLKQVIEVNKRRH